MFSPHTITFNGRTLLVSRHDGADYHGPVPWRIRVNPLRYSLTFFPGTPRNRTINRDGRLARHWSNLLFSFRGEAAKQNAMADLILIASQDGKNTLLPYRNAEAMYKAVVYHRRWWCRLRRWPATQPVKTESEG